MTVENTAPEAVEEKIEITVTEDLPEAQEVSSDDELERYTKSVSKRINKLNQKNREAEDRARYLEAVAMQKEQELQHYREQSVLQAQTVLEKEEEALKAKESQVDDIYRKAIQSGDADLISKADTLKNDVAIQKEKLRVAQSRHAQQQPQQPAQENYQPYRDQYQPNQQQAQPLELRSEQMEEPKPTDEALSWHEKNKWYGDGENEENLQATQFAYFTHYNLINEGYEPDSDEYYNELDKRVFRVYPNLQSVEAEEPVEQSEARPGVQRVASASPAGRQQTRGQQRGVKFETDELQRILRLKPHNMSEEAWLQRVAAEKKKIQAREAR
jgi:hypothetical protein|tara:strand:- start:111 stop:1094 length:984 start_codon:yes stop_codon:yes gene_type:complete